MAAKTNDSTARIAQALHAAKNVCIVSHYNPDSDALGATCALALALKNAGKQVSCVNESGVPERYRFLPGSDAVAASFDPSLFDLVCILDCGEVKRVGESLLACVKAATKSLNIDHHITNDFFGTLNLVETKACSTCELVFEVLQAAKFLITPEVASCLYAGICGDTGSFRYASTTLRSFEIAASLVKSGASPNLIADAIYGSKPLSQVRLESLALSQLEMHEHGKLCEVLVTDEMYRKCGASSEDAEFLVETARDIKGVLIALLIKRDGDLWKVSLRSASSKLDMSKVAQQFGGGGHRAAAAFRFRKSLEELRGALLSALRQALADAQL